MQVNSRTLKLFLTRELRHIDDQFIQMLDAAFYEFDRVQRFRIVHAVTQHGDTETNAAQRIADLVGHLRRRLSHRRQRLAAP